MRKVMIFLKKRNTELIFVKKSFVRNQIFDSFVKRKNYA